jgi:hypothetical protein
VQYVLIYAADESVELSPSQVGQAESELAAWLEKAIGDQVNVHGTRLCPTSDATTVRVRGGETLVSDGPFVETKEQVAGYDLMDCSSLDEAVSWAAKHPHAWMGSVEVRPFRGDGLDSPLPAQKPGTTRYAMLVCLPHEIDPELLEAAKVGPSVDAWVEEMDGRGTRLFGQQLEGLEAAHTVRVRGDEVIVSDGPFAETKELIAGFDILECADLDEALEVASKHAVARFGSLELRPFWVAPES